MYPAPKARLLSSQSGFTLIEILISTFILSLAFYMLSDSFQSISHAIRKNDYSANIYALKQGFSSLIQDRSAFAITRGENITFECWEDPRSNGTGCAGITTPQPFNLYTSSRELFSTRVGNDTRYYQPVGNANHGFTIDGAVCYTFRAKPAPADNECVIRADFYWQPRCVLGAARPCFRPEIDVQIEFSFNFPDSMNMGMIALNSFNRSIRLTGESMPLRLTGPVNKVCPNGTIVSQIDPATGRMSCINGSTTLYPNGNTSSPSRNTDASRCYYNQQAQNTCSATNI